MRKVSGLDSYFRIVVEIHCQNNVNKSTFVKIEFKTNCIVTVLYQNKSRSKDFTFSPHSERILQ